VDEPRAGFEAAHTTVLQPEVKLTRHQPEDVNEVSMREEQGRANATDGTHVAGHARVEVIITVTD
jgi:hypothetical protein